MELRTEEGVDGESQVSERARISMDSFELKSGFMIKSVSRVGLSWWAVTEVADRVFR